MGSDKDKLEYAPFNNSGWYGPSPKKVAPQNEADTQNDTGMGGGNTDMW